MAHYKTKQEQEEKLYESVKAVFRECLDFVDGMGVVVTDDELLDEGLEEFLSDRFEYLKEILLDFGGGEPEKEKTWAGIDAKLLARMAGEKEDFE